MRVVIDYVAFRGNGEVTLLKEVAVAEVGGRRREHFLFRAPYPWTGLDESLREENGAGTLRFHGIRWDDGHIEYGELPEVLKRAVHRATAIYALGRDKVQVLSKILGRTVIDLMEFGAPRPDVSGFLGDSCLHPCHRIPLMRCALRDADVMARWFEFYRAKLATENLCIKAGVKGEAGQAAGARSSGARSVCPGEC